MLFRLFPERNAFTLWQHNKPLFRKVCTVSGFCTGFKYHVKTIHILDIIWKAGANQVQSPSAVT